MLTSLELLLFDRMALLLDTWLEQCDLSMLDESADHDRSRNALILGVLYLAFQAFPIIFEGVHGFDMQMTGLTFIGIGLGMLSAVFTQPFWNR